MSSGYIRTRDGDLTREHVDRAITFLAAMIFFPVGLYFAIKILIEEAWRFPSALGEIIASPRKMFPYLLAPVIGYTFLIWIPWNATVAIGSHMAEQEALGGLWANTLDYLSDIPALVAVFNAINSFL